MRKRYFVLPVVVAIATGTIAVIQTYRSPQIEGLISETRISRPNHGLATTLDSADDRTNLDPRELISLDVKLNAGKGKLHVVAPNGGSINHGHGHLQMDPPRQGEGVHLDYQAGESPGRYTVEITQGNATKTLEFWVGPEPPVGKPGPQLTFPGTH
jgi:hypothetical protein